MDLSLYYRLILFIYCRMFAYFIYNQYIINISNKTYKGHVLTMIYFLLFFHWTVDSLINRLLNLFGIDYFLEE